MHFEPYTRQHDSDARADAPVGLNQVMLAIALSLSFTLGFAQAENAYANDIELGKFKDWTAHSYTEQDGKVCNMWSRPQKADVGGRPRGDVMAFVTHFPVLGKFSEISFKMGFPVNPNRDAIATVGRSKFKLTPEGEFLFVQDGDKKQLLDAMRRGSRMIITATSTRGTPSRDTYSLSGVTASVRALDASCPS